MRGWGNSQLEKLECSTVCTVSCACDTWFEACLGTGDLLRTTRIRINTPYGTNLRYLVVLVVESFLTEEGLAEYQLEMQPLQV